MSYKRLGILLVLAAAGCDGGGYERSSSSPAPPSGGPPPSPAGDASHGRFVGTVTIGDTDYLGDAVVTVDGAVRLYVGDPYSASGALPLTPPVTSAQFVGNVAADTARTTGTGIIIGQSCADAQVNRFCSETASGGISIEFESGNLRGEIHVVSSAVDETWVLNLGLWENYYYAFRASPGDMAGQYQEDLAEFALDGDTIVNVDAAGQLTFQSAQSGCTGNGTLIPHEDGAFFVFDATLTIGNCTGDYAYLNGPFEGLATSTPSDYWNYDSLLLIWLSSPSGAPSRVALTMLGMPQYGTP